MDLEGLDVEMKNQCQILQKLDNLALIRYLLGYEEIRNKLIATIQSRTKQAELEARLVSLENERPRIHLQHGRRGQERKIDKPGSTTTL